MDLLFQNVSDGSRAKLARICAKHQIALVLHWSNYVQVLSARHVALLPIWTADIWRYLNLRFWIFHDEEQKGLFVLLPFDGLQSSGQWAARYFSMNSAARTEKMALAQFTDPLARLLTMNFVGWPPVSSIHFFISPLGAGRLSRSTQRRNVTMSKKVPDTNPPWHPVQRKVIFPHGRVELVPS